MVAGQAVIGQSTPSSMQVKQGTQSAIINWGGFSIAGHESVVFQQPSASSVVLNRVIGSSASDIFGRLSANGQVFLVNPNGIFFARGAQVDTGGLVASSLGISNESFLSGRYTFQKDGAAGSVVNAGTITTLSGYAALIGPQVSNSGVINARLGTAALAAGDRVTLDMVGDGLINVHVDSAAVNASALNSGTITADGGNVLMTARSANALLDTVVNTTGVIRANTMVEREGSIIIDGGGKGVTSVSGTLQAAGQGAGEKGGTVKVLGHNVGLFDNAKIDASGDAGGGVVLIGGNFQGKGPEANAFRTYVGPNATISADALTSGDGGKVIVWSDDSTRFYGSISARGGAQSGDGGFAEVSGKENLLFLGKADLRAPRGKTGTLLLDPADIVIQGGATAGDEQILETAGADVTLQAKNSITVSGTFGFDSGNGEGAAAIVRMGAGRSLTMETRNAATEGAGGINLTVVTVKFETQTTGNITLRAGVTGTGVGGDAGTANITTGALQTLGTDDE